MILFGRPELVCTHDVSVDQVALIILNFSRKHFFLKFIFDPLSYLKLEIRMEENSWCILWSFVVFLSILLSRIVKCEEMLDQRLVWSSRLIVDDVSDFNMACLAFANFLVWWILMLVWDRIHVPDCRSDDTVWVFFLKILREELFSTPETSCPKGCNP